MRAQTIADKAVRQSLNEAFKSTGEALARSRPTVTAGEVLKVHLRAIRAYLRHATRSK